MTGVSVQGRQVVLRRYHNQIVTGLEQSPVSGTSLAVLAGKPVKKTDHEVWRNTTNGC